MQLYGDARKWTPLVHRGACALDRLTRTHACLHTRCTGVKTNGALNRMPACTHTQNGLSTCMQAHRHKDACVPAIYRRSHWCRPSCIFYLPIKSDNFYDCARASQHPSSARVRNEHAK
eukprot:4118500-Pleurochrysis_carterae.AAC.1